MLAAMRPDRPRLMLRDTACLLVLALLAATATAMTAGAQASGSDLRCVTLVEAGSGGLHATAASLPERGRPCTACGHLGRLPATRSADAAPASWRTLDLPPPTR